MTKYQIHTDGSPIYLKARGRIPYMLTPEDFLDLQQAMRDFTAKTLRLGIKAGEKN
jgi:hypothetical protein